jgi:general secretion pathway protein L
MPNNKLWDWWIAGLAAPWPRALRERLWRRRHVLARPAESGFEFVTRQGDGWRTLWRTAGDGPPPAGIRRRLRGGGIVLWLPKHCALDRSVSVPPDTAAAVYVETRLEQLTPFTVDQAYFDTVGTPGEANLRLVVARKTEVDRSLQQLRESGLRAKAVTVEGYEHTSLDLLPADQTPRSRPDTAGAFLVLAGIMLCAAAVYRPFYDQQRALEALNEQAARLESQLARGEDARERLRELRARAAMIAERRLSRPDTVALLAAVTGAVPDHSWVRQWVLHNGSLTLHGESGNTADLITRLEASPLLRNVRYDAAITRDSDSGNDRFKLVADTGHGGS